jgi:hypothetical protein
MVIIGDLLEGWKNMKRTRENHMLFSPTLTLLQPHPTYHKIHLSYWTKNLVKLKTDLFCVGFRYGEWSECLVWKQISSLSVEVFRWWMLFGEVSASCFTEIIFMIPSLKLDFSNKKLSFRWTALRSCIFHCRIMDSHAYCPKCIMHFRLNTRERSFLSS